MASLQSTPNMERLTSGKSFSTVFTFDFERFTGKKRYRIRGSGVQGSPSTARLTGHVVAALRREGVTVREYSESSPVNVDSFHLEAKFKDGGLTASTGAYWYSERGAWVSGEQAVRWVADLLHLRPQPIATGVAPPKLQSRLLGAYRETDYTVLCKPEVHIHVGEESASTVTLFSQIAANTAVVITAWNPFSQKLSVIANESRNAELLDCVTNGDYAYLRAEGRDPSGVWPAESSFLVFDVSNGVIDLWLTNFDQHAAVCVQRSGVATLAMHPGQR